MNTPPRDVSRHECGKVIPERSEKGSKKMRKKEEKGRKTYKPEESWKRKRKRPPLGDGCFLGCGL